MTPEEILKANQSNTTPFHPNIGEGEWVSKDDAIKALQQYAAQEREKEAVGFAEWCNKKYKRLGIINGVTQWAIPNSMDEYTTFDLYAIYLKEKGGEGL
jgi:hypothetical protein